MKKLRTKQLKVKRIVKNIQYSSDILSKISSIHILINKSGYFFVKVLEIISKVVYNNDIKI